MKIHSVKHRITLWYTLIIVVVFSAVIISASLYSEYYGEDEIREDLSDEVKDFKEDVVLYLKHLPGEKYLSYYDDEVVLSIYDKEYNYLEGIVPDEFPKNLKFVDGRMDRIKSGDENWFVNDIKVEVDNGNVIWIRGIHPYSSILLLMKRSTLVLIIVLPLLALFTAFIGYRMIRRSLLPINSIVDTANEITSSAQLARRIQLPKSRDEFYYLTTTVNEMLSGLEESFKRERQFSSDAAHELRTPLAIILSHCEYCLEELEPDEKMKEEIKIIRNKTNQMSKLVSSLLTISRQEKEDFKPNYEEVELAYLAQSVAEELEEKAAVKEIDIKVYQETENATIMADISMMMRMLINLVENAINYGKRGGYIKILIDDMGERDILVRVEDDGIGISTSDQKKIWNRFYQVDSSHSQSEGFGLGLYMVKQIVGAHKGTIQVESEKGKGSTFTVVIPRGEGF